MVCEGFYKMQSVFCCSGPAGVRRLKPEKTKELKQLKAVESVESVWFWVKEPGWPLGLQLARGPMPGTRQPKELKQLKAVEPVESVWFWVKESDRSSGR